MSRRKPLPMTLICKPREPLWPLVLGIALGALAAWLILLTYHHDARRAAELRHAEEVIAALKARCAT
jgi:hypothetical protein